MDELKESKAVAGNAINDVDRIKFNLAEAEKDLAAASSKAKKDTAKIDRLTALVSRLTSLLQTPMIRAAYSDTDSAVGARPEVLAGIDKPTISPTDDEEARTIEGYRSVAPNVNGYYGYTFVDKTRNSEKTHVVLYTDKRDKRISYVMTGAADDGNVYSDGRETGEVSWKDHLVTGIFTDPPQDEGMEGVKVDGRYIERYKQVDGTYDDIAGTYECIEPDNYCYVGKNQKMGVIKFTPTTPPADDYLTFGVWLTVPERATEMHPVGAFATGNDPFNGDVSKLKEIATYEGPAVGIYGKRAADSTTADVGSFTATASLKANFGNKYMVSGYVMGFEENGISLGEWKVNLKTGDGLGGDTQISKTGKNFDMKSTGKWSGQFYGNGKVTDHPGSVAGTFNTKTGTLIMEPLNDKGFLGIVGAFGAKKVMPPTAK